MNGTHAVFLCYRKDDWKTFQNLYAWYKSVSFYFSNTTLVYLVETMGDKATNDIKPLELKAFIKNNGIIKQFKTKKDDIEGIQAMFTEAVIEVEKAIAQLNIQLSSPRKINNSGNLSGRSGSGNRVSVIYTDKNEEVKLVDGSYIKKPKVPDTAKESHEMLEAKNLTDEKVELEAI
jgi:Ras family.